MDTQQERRQTIRHWQFILFYMFLGGLVSVFASWQIYYYFHPVDPEGDFKNDSINGLILFSVITPITFLVGLLLGAAFGQFVGAIVRLREANSIVGEADKLAPMKRYVFVAWLYCLVWGITLSFLWGLFSSGARWKDWEFWLGLLLLPLGQGISFSPLSLVLATATLFLFARTAPNIAVRVNVVISILAGACVWGMFAGNKAAFLPSLMVFATTLLSGLLAARLLRETTWESLRQKIADRPPIVGMVLATTAVLQIFFLFSCLTPDLPTKEKRHQVSPDGAFVAYIVENARASSEVVRQPRYCVLGLFREYLAESEGIGTISWKWTGPHTIHVSYPPYK